MADEPWLGRFLAPRYAVSPVDSSRWSAAGSAETPGADARCRIFLGVAPTGALTAGFAVYGPPVAIAAADWLCEQVIGVTVEMATALDARAVEQALSLAPEERYAALLVADALANALSNLGR